MTFSIIWTKEAKEDLNKLEREMSIRIFHALKRTKENPFYYFKKLTGKERTWRLRVGNYRVLADVDGYKQIVTLLTIRHRKNVYDR